MAEVLRVSMRYDKDHFCHWYFVCESVTCTNRFGSGDAWIADGIHTLYNYDNQRGGTLRKYDSLWQTVATEDAYPTHTQLDVPDGLTPEVVQNLIGVMYVIFCMGRLSVKDKDNDG